MSHKIDDNPMTQVTRWVWILIAMLSTNCAEKTEQDHQKVQKTAQTNESVEVYSTSGLVRSISERKNLIVVAHGEIPGFMEAMTMPFLVEDTSLVSSINPGDSVALTFSFDGSKILLTEISNISP